MRRASVRLGIVIDAGSFGHIIRGVAENIVACDAADVMKCQTISSEELTGECVPCRGNTALTEVVAL